MNKSEFLMFRNKWLVDLFISSEANFSNQGQQRRYCWNICPEGVFLEIAYLFDNIWKDPEDPVIMPDSLVKISDVKKSYKKKPDIYGNINKINSSLTPGIFKVTLDMSELTGMK